MKNLILTQFFVLVAGTMFAWGNFTMEVINYLNRLPCGTSCTAELTNPLLTPCFYGALVFTLTLILNILIMVKSKVCK